MKKLIPRTGHPIHLVLGLIIWSIWFVLLYGGLSVACEVAPPDPEEGAWNWVNAIFFGLAIIVMVVLLGGAYVSWRHAPSAVDRKPQARFMGRVAAAVYLFAACSALAVAMPVLVLPPCL